ncbi:MAG TPA: hypothetical protein VMW95_04535 [Desulfobacterales bacterium]|nr:hypothetical protein [Desulfobacterales bacterium]
MINRFELWLCITIAACTWSWFRGLINYWFPKKESHVFELDISGKPFWDEK